MLKTLLLASIILYSSAVVLEECVLGWFGHENPGSRAFYIFREEDWLPIPPVHAVGLIHGM